MEIQVSVIMPVYNAEMFLAESIESILNQSFKNFELIILNDNSTDKSESIINFYKKKDSRIVYIKKEKNQGPAVLRNEGISISKGIYIALNDADDISELDRFEKQFKVLSQNSNIGVCGSWYTEFGENVKYNVVKTTGNSDLFKVLFLSYNCIGNSTAMFRKDLLEIIRFDESFLRSEDYKFWSELIQKTNFYIIQKSLLNYRIHKNNISKTKIELIKEAEIKVKLELICKELKIPENKINSEYLLNIINYKKGATKDEILNWIKYSKELIILNNKYQKFNPILFEERIHFILTKSIKKMKDFDFNFIKYLKKNEKAFYNKIPLNMKLFYYYRLVFKNN